MGRVFRFGSAFLAACLFSVSLSTTPLAGQETPTPEVPATPDDLVIDDVEVPGPVPSASTQEITRDQLLPPTPTAPPSDGFDATGEGWVEEEDVTVAVTPGQDVSVGDSPVAVRLESAEAALLDAPIANSDASVSSVSVSVIGEEHARQMSPFASAASFGFSDPTGDAVNPTEPFEVSFDLSDVELSNDASLLQRLTMTRWENCELFEPSAEYLESIADSLIDPSTVPGEVICDSADEIEAEFDAATRTLTATVDNAAIERQQNNADGVFPDAPSAKAGRTAAVDAVDFGDLVFSLTTDTSSSSGDFAALPVPRRTDAQVGLFTGAAETSYPITVPPAAAGPEPSVAFVYSSAGIDSMQFSSNNQTGPLGVGWSLAATGSITRGLTGCDDPAAAEDLCLSSAPDEVYSLSLAGQSSKLVRVDGGSATANPKEFRLEADPFWRVRLWQDNGVTNPTFNNEWWTVETPDGTVYRLGTSDDSVDWVPAWYPGANSPCTETYALCDTARQWNLTSVTDVLGNEMNYEYVQEMNSYRARGLGTNIKFSYVQASHVDTITYGGNPSTSSPANARVVFNWELRCGQSGSFSGCGTYPNAFHDTPTDLRCRADNPRLAVQDVCTEVAPTFWTHLRLGGVLSQVVDGNTWVTVEHVDPTSQFVRDGAATALDSELQQVVSDVAQRPIDSNGATAGGAYARNGFDTLWAADFDERINSVFFNVSQDIGTEAVVSHFGRDDAIRFNDVWMGDSGSEAATVTLRVSAIRAGNYRVRTGSVTGPVLATLTVNTTNFTNSLLDFETFTLDIAAGDRVNGVHDIFVTADSTATSLPLGYVSFLQFGNPGAVSSTDELPTEAEVSYTDGSWTYLNNRVNHPGGVSAMRFPRIKTITNEIGGQVTFTYGQDLRCPAGKVDGWDTNDEDCFPQPDAETGVYVIFNKWPVQSITSGQTVSEQPDVVTTYDYQGAGWGFSDNPDSNFDTWSDFRGYNIVTATTPTAGKTETRFHQGLHVERVSPFPQTRTVTVARSDGTQIADAYALRGRVYETRQLTDAGAEISRSTTNFRNSATVSGNTNRDDPRFVAPSDVATRTDGIANTRTLIQYDAWGQTTSVNERGDTSTADDNRTTVTLLYPPGSNGTAIGQLGSWRSTMPCVTAVRAGNSVGAPSATNAAAAFDRWSLTAYDGDSVNSCASSVDVPIATATSVAIFGSGRLTTEQTLDNRGRVETITEPRGVNTTGVADDFETTISYDSLHGEVAGTTNALGWTTTTDYDTWRRPTVSTDVRGDETRTTYDEYSRVLTVRGPHDVSDNADSIRYIYRTTTYPASVQTRTRLNGTENTNSVTFVDGFGRSLLTRSSSPEPNVFWTTASRYDVAGRLDRTSAQYVPEPANLVSFEYPVWTAVPSANSFTFDEASRPLESATIRGNGTKLFTSSTSYHGFRTRFTDQNGSWTDTIVDGLGRTTNLIEQQGTPDLETKFEYSPADDLEQIEAPDGEITTITYDAAGRKLTTDEPDSGLWEYGYDANSNLTRQQDPLGDETIVSFDQLNRRAQATVNGTLRGQWTYDQASSTPDGPVEARGLPHEERNFDTSGQGAVIRRFGYDQWARMTSDTTVTPKADGPGVNTFTTNYTLRDDGQPASIQHPSGTSGQSTYQVNYTYNPRTGAPQRLVENGAGGEVIVDDVTWNQAGQITSHSYGPDTGDPAATWVYNAFSLRLVQDHFGTNAFTTRDRLNVYTYDSNANITSIREVRNSNQHQCFTYDQIDRLLTAFTDNTSDCGDHTPVGDGNYSDTYSYSRGGNINSRTGTGDGSHPGTYTYGDPDLAHAVTATSDGSVFSYNANGDMETRTLVGEPTQTLEWDFGRRLSSVSQTVEGGTELTVPVEPAGPVLNIDLELAPTTTTCGGLPVTVDLGAGDTPTAGNDVILGTSGVDTISAGDGDDVICSLGGDDIINAGPGNDRVDAGPGADSVFGLAGDDELFGGTGGDVIIGFDGADTIDGGTNDDTINGSAGNDTLLGGAGSDEVFGQGGADTIDGGSGNDQLNGVDGADTIRGGDGADTINGGPDDDTIYGDIGNDTIFGLTGNDTIWGGNGSDNVFGQAGDDSVNGGNGNDQIFGNEDNDALSDPAGTNVFNGGPGDDELAGGTGNDQMFGDGDLAHAGNDIIAGGGGNDLIVAFAGNDTIYAGDTSADTVNGGPGTDTCEVDTVDTVFNCSATPAQTEQVTDFLYAIDDMRVRRADNTGTATYYHADGTEYAVDATGNGVFTYYHQMGSRTVAYTTSDDEVTTWMFSDIINSTGATIDENGARNTARYTPWGEARGTTPQLTTDHTFTGQIEDRSTGLSFYNARYYDPAVGRFISPDTIIPNPENGQDFNGFTYVRNSPTVLIDPTGNFCVELGFGQRYCLVDPIEIDQINQTGTEVLETLDVYSCEDDANLGQCIGDVPGSIQTGAGYIGAGCATTGVVAPITLPATGPCAGVAEATAVSAGLLETVADCAGAAISQSGGTECGTAILDVGFDVLTGPFTQPARIAVDSLVTVGKDRSIVGSIVDQFLFDHRVPASVAEKAADTVEKLAPVVFPIIKEVFPDFLYYGAP